MSRPCRVVQAYDRSLIKEIRADEADALEAKLEVCVSTQRIFVHSDIKAEFVERLAARVRVLRVGDPLLADTEVGPLIVPRDGRDVRREDARFQACRLGNPATEESLAVAMG